MASSRAPEMLDFGNGPKFGLTLLVAKRFSEDQSIKRPSVSNFGGEDQQLCGEWKRISPGE